jgi:hypothetical protein
MPSAAFAKSISRRAMPPRFINWPARMKNGIASSAKLSRPVAMRWATVVNAGSEAMPSSMVIRVPMPMAKATGTPSSSSVAKTATSTRT